MDSDITVELFPLLGVCNLCLNEGVVKNMLTERTDSNEEEVYADMLLKCFNIDISKLQLGDNKKVICEACILRLRDSISFRELAENSLKVLENGAYPCISVVKNEIDDASEGLDSFSLDASYDIKTEVLEDIDDGFDCEDDEAIADILIKKEEFNTIGRNGKRLNYKKKIRKELKLKNCINMLEKGLIPFKLNKRGFGCTVCPEKCDSLDGLRDHFTKHREKFILLAFKKTNLSTQSRFFTDKTSFICKYCSAKVTHFEELKSHVNSCTKYAQSKLRALPFKLEKDQVDCPICKRKFLNFVNLNTHMNLHYPNYICENCGKAFATKSRLRAHMRTHELGEFPCKLCGQVFDKITKRENHVSKEHKAGVRYACKKCNISLTSFYAKQKHMADVHQEDLKKYKCNACSQSYVTPGHLSSHVRRDHLNERNFKCEKCDLAFYTRNALKMHMIKHDGERIHSCPICQKAYQRKKTLKEHMRIHNNDKRFVCPYCGRAFTQKCTLKGHLKVHERKPDLAEIETRVAQPMHSI